MTYPLYLREKARGLRVEKRLTIDELAEGLALSRTTVYYWVKDLRIDRTTRQTIGQRAGNQKMQDNYRRRREQAYQDGLCSFDELAIDPTFRDFVNLYIAEGYKRCRNVVSIANSDPAVISLADRWIRRLTDRPIRYRLQYHRDQDPDYLARFWGFRFGVERSTVYLQRKSNSSGLTARRWRSRWGVLTIEVNDTQLRMRLEGWIVALRQRWLDSSPPGRGAAW
jgi:hypothetical protein